MGCTGKLRLCLIDAPPRPKVSYFKDKVRQPAEVLGTPKTAISVEPSTLPSKARSGQANSDILYQQCPNSTTKGTKDTKEPFSIQPFVQIRVVRGSQD